MNEFDKKVWALNRAIMSVDPKKDYFLNSRQHIGLNPEILPMRRELYDLHMLNIDNRKRWLRKVYIEDFLLQERELREVGLAHINVMK